MDINSYLNELKSSDNTENPISKANESNQAFLTIKVDINCEVLCDGEPLCTLIAQKAQKESISLGEHLLSIVSVLSDKFVKDETINIKRTGENQVLILSYKQEEERFLQQLGIQKSKDEEYESLLNDKSTTISKLEVKLFKAKTDIKKLQEDLIQQKDNYELIIQDKDIDISTQKQSVAQLKQEISEQRQKYESQLKDKDRTLDHKEEELKKAKAPTDDLEKKLKEKESAISELESKLTETQDRCNRRIKEKEQECAIQVREMKIELERSLDHKDKEHAREIEEMRTEFTQFKNRVKEEIAQRDKTIAYLEAHHQDTSNDKKGGSLFSRLIGK